VTHSRAWFLIPFYGTRSEYYRVDENGWKLTLRSGRTLRFIFTPYLHFPGAIMTYDEKSKILFSSDVFGGISYDWGLYAKEWYLEAVKAFHENYMAHHDYLKHAMEKLEKLDISMICPQHGSIIPKDKVKEFIAALKDLPCGSFAGEDAGDMAWLKGRK
jgi:flavorubredoxin